MPNFVSSKTWVTGEPILAIGLNAIGSDVETFVNTTKLDSSNVQAGGLSNDRLANSTYIFTKELVCADEGGRTIVNFQLYATQLDVVKIPVDCTLIGIHAVNSANVVATNQFVQVDEVGVGSFTPLACVSSTSSAAPTTRVENHPLSAGDLLGARMTGTTALTELPCRVTLYFRAELS